MLRSRHCLARMKFYELPSVLLNDDIKQGLNLTELLRINVLMRHLSGQEVLVFNNESGYMKPEAFACHFAKEKTKPKKLCVLSKHLISSSDNLTAHGRYPVKAKVNILH